MINLRPFNEAASQNCFRRSIESCAYACIQHKEAILNGIRGVTAVALFVIGCIGAAGVFPGSTIGWTTIGLGGGAFALTLAMRCRKFFLIIATTAFASFVTLGALGAAGILSGTQIGWGVVGTSLAAGFYYSIVQNRLEDYCTRRRQLKLD